MDKKPLPPFGNIVEAFQKEGLRLEFPLYIFVGRKAFEEAKYNKSLGIMSLVLPHGKSVDDYHWPIKGHKIVLTDTGSMSVIGMKKICLQLLKRGAISVCLFSELCPIEVFTQPNL